MKPYLFTSKRVAKPKREPIKSDFSTKLPAQLESPGLIQGQMPKSLPEWWASLALDKLKLGYEFQYSVMGGYSIRGGQIVDFFVYTVPLPTPVQIEGDYWHGGVKNAETQFKNAQLNRYFEGYAQKVEEIWVEKSDDRESVFNKIRKALLV